MNGAANPGPQAAATGPPAGRGGRLEAFFAELYQRSGARELGLAQEQFARVLAEIGAKYLPPEHDQARAAEFYRGLRIEELALARACAAGSEPAWDAFLVRYRAKLYEAAYGMVRDEVRARELADSLYAELYGTETRDGQRISKLAYYTGRGSLEGWLRAVLAQQHVNSYRRTRREVSLEEKTEDGMQFAASDPQPAGGDARLVAATDEALAGLSAEERFILAAYYLDGRRLAEIGRMLGVHESTVSRKLERIAAGVRIAVVDALLRRGMSRAQAEEALETDVRDLALDVRRRLSQETGSSAFLTKDD